MIAKIIILLTILIFLSINVFAQRQRASSFVQSFYKFFRANSAMSMSDELNAYNKWFTPELNRLFQYELQREEEFLKKNPTDKPHYGDGLPFDPPEDCIVNQKWFRNILKIGKTSIKRNKTLVEVKFYEAKVCGGRLIDTYKVELIPNKNSWLINDWIYPNNRERLTKHLKRENYTQ